MSRQKSTGTEYDRIQESVCCRVVVIEVVLRQDWDAEAEPTDIEEVLENLRCYNAAEVVDDFYVRSDFDDTTDVLFQRHKVCVSRKKGS